MPSKNTNERAILATAWRAALWVGLIFLGMAALGAGLAWVIDHWPAALISPFFDFPPSFWPTAAVSLFATAVVVWAICVETMTEQVSTGLRRIRVAGIIGWIVMIIASLMNSSTYKTWGDLETHRFLVALVVSWAPIFCLAIALYLFWPSERKG
ncbi:hypothetical protein A7J71_20555 [Achromobacter insolitus]|uniref:hypothetical protein n=1 Tax=Achromobacter insolitus TaxID=217204 RepID=UPI0007C7FD7E|nr:hypothetical protein [Achromobacter insolitus]OAE71645.1 hypothetical protein A7J71_20555 [Achromobacter insolitus]OCZ52948.1 hypothetical protein A7P22_16295 [Achromobacter insolitus]